MNEKRNIWWWIAGIIVLLTLLWLLRTIVIYILIAAVITMIIRPLDKRLEKVRLGKTKIPRAARAATLLLFIYAIVFAFVSIFIPLFINEVNVISQVDRNQVMQALHEPISQLEYLFRNLNQDKTNHLTLEEYLQQYLGQVLNVAQVSNLAGSIVTVVGNLVVAFFAVSFFTFFFIKDGDVILHMLLMLAPARQMRKIRNVVRDTQSMLSKYFIGVLLDVLFVSTFVGTGMALLGVQNALIIGIFAGIMNIIPYVGPLIGGAFAIIVAISTNLTLDFYTGLVPLSLKIGGVFLVMNLVDGFLVQPFIFSNTVKAHPLEIFTVILVAGSLAGIGAMVVAVPFYTVLRIILREFVTKSRFVQRLTDNLDEAIDKADRS